MPQLTHTVNSHIRKISITFGRLQSSENLRLKPHLTAAMQLFGRAHNTLSHVLVGEDFETNPEFFYPPPEPRPLRTRDGREVSTADADVYLADVPFIRLVG